ALRMEESSSTIRISGSMSLLISIFSRHYRQAQREHRPALRAVGGPEPASVGLDDGAADGEPQAHPLTLGRVEGFEYATHGIRAHAPAGVTNRERHLSAGAHPALNRDDPRSAGSLGEGVNGVDQEVYHHLPEP